MKITTRQLNRDELHLVRQVADKVWPMTFRPILSEEQIAYMMEMMYASDVMEREFADGIRFYGVFDGDSAVGYYIWGPCNEAPGTAKLHKCYLLAEYQGKGIGSRMLAEAKGQAEAAGYSTIRLNVNRHNEKAMKAYFRNGFKAVAMVDNPIGNGFYMNDFIMEATLGSHAERQISEEESKRLTVIASLSEDFDYVCYVDFATGRFTRYRTSRKFLDVLEETDPSLSFAERFRLVFTKIVHPEDLPQFLENVAEEKVLKELADKPVYKFETRLIYGETPEFFRFKFVRDPHNRNAVTVGLLNVDLQVRAEILHGEQEARLESMAQLKRQDEERRRYSDMAIALSDSYECIYYVNIDDDNYLEFNRKSNFKTLGSETLGRDFFSSIKKNLAASVHQEDLAAVLEFIDKASAVEAVANGDTISKEYRVVSDGTTVYYRMKVVKLRTNDKRLVVAIENVDDEVRARNVQQKQLEEALQMAQSANRAKTAFLNNMSHDIRTPMNAIIGFSGLAASHIDNKEQVLAYLQKIGQSSDHLLSLINEVLDMSRIESGKMNLNEKPESLAEILHTLRDIIHADINAKQIELFIDTVDVSNEMVVCDKLRLSQVLLNICSNAIKYTRPGGTVTIRIIQKAVSKTGYGTYEFHIKDNGIGMSDEYVKTIFEPFTRESTSTVSGIQGTGLGMAITKNIVDMMGGTIDVFTKKNEGTEFIISIDFRLADEAVARPVRIAKLEGLRGLVVDDDSNTCLSVAKMLRDTGMRPEWCMSGREAVLRTEEALQIGDLYKVYIIDWLMPDMNGVETARRIRRAVGDSVPIIILSAYDWADVEEEAREAGVTGFVSKPMFPSDLHKALMQFCGEEEDAEGPADDGGMEFAGRRILLVEDNELNREIAQELLEENGFVVDTASDGTIAVEKMKAAKDGDYDLVLMDVQMPIMNGYDATVAIRSMDSAICRSIPIVAMTANAFAEDREAALEAGMNDHVAKPIKADVLFDSIRKLLKITKK